MWGCPNVDVTDDKVRKKVVAAKAQTLSTLTTSTKSMNLKNGPFWREAVPFRNIFHT